MFTGLIEATGEVVAARIDNDNARELRIAAPEIAPTVQTGESIAVNGCCLTVAAKEDDCLRFDLLGETVSRTNLGRLGPRALVNLERALAADGRLGGHFVQGHIDCTAPIIAFEETPGAWRLEIGLPSEQARFVVEQGSIAVNGISLTVAQLTDVSFTTWIIPHTRRCTNLNTAGAGDLANLEFDLLAKYVERLLRSP